MTKEEFALSFVESGVLEIEQNGMVWRLMDRGVVCERRRAEKPTSRGYLRVRVCGRGCVVDVKAHRLVWCFFNGEIPDGLEINHRNGDKLDNTPDNLEIVTRSENLRHAHEVLGVAYFGGKSGRRPSSAPRIIELWRAGVGEVQIAAELGLGLRRVASVLLGAGLRTNRRAEHARRIAHDRFHVLAPSPTCSFCSTCHIAP